MPKDYLPQVGDVIRSIRFVYGERSFDETDKRITVGRDEPQYIVSRYPTEEEIVAYVMKFKRVPPEGACIEEDFGSVDLTRAKAEYVVIEAMMQGGGSGMGVIYGHHDEYPDGWHVVAKRLDSGRKWNADGEEIQFYVSGCFINMIPSDRILKVGELKMRFS